jgi:tetratricopeptide (TPR) repeat protein
MALDYGRWMLFAKPKKIEGYSQFDLERNLDRLITIYTEVGNKQEDPTVRSTYLDSALHVFDVAFETFGDEKEFDNFDWQLKKARFYQQNKDHISNAMSKAIDLYMELYKQNPERFTKRGEGYYVQVVLQQLISNGEKDQALSLIKKTEPYASEKLLSYYDSVRGRLFDTPQQRIDFLKSQIESEPKNVKLLDELLQIYEEQEMYAEAKDIAERLYKLESNFDNAIRLAEIAMNNANYPKAITYLKEAMGKTDENSKLKRVAIDLAESYLNENQLQQAREWARKASNYDEDWGKPYLFISNIYARSVSNCTSDREMDRQDKVVYWLVLDYLDKARQVDETTTSTVEQRYKSYEPVTPTQEEKFFKNWKTGEEIKVGANLHKCYGWINETTTIR